ncbi:MAG: helix-turn-helix transcriptional regulator [Candidatus Omnitrophota bacterium]
MGMKKVDDHLREELKDPHFAELYELEAQKFQVVKRMIAARIQYGWTQADLAQKAGVTQQHVSKIESGEFSNLFALEKILGLLGLAIRVRVITLPGKSAGEPVTRVKGRKTALRHLDKLVGPK